MTTGGMTSQSALSRIIAYRFGAGAFGICSFIGYSIVVEAIHPCSTRDALWKACYFLCASVTNVGVPDALSRFWPFDLVGNSLPSRNHLFVMVVFYGTIR